VPQPSNLLLVQLAQWGIFALSALIFLVTGDLGSRGRWLEWATWTFLALAAVVVLEYFVPPLRSALGWSRPTMADRSLFWTWLAALATGQLLFNRRLAPLARIGLLVLLAAAAYVVWFKLNDWISGWAPFTLVAGAVIWLRMWRRNRLAGLVLMVALVVVAAFLYPLVFEHAGGEAELAMSGGGRLTLYRAVVDLVGEHPLLGLGPAAYRHYGFTRWLSGGIGRALWIRPNLSSHNNYIDVEAQVGLVGLAVFLWFVGEVGALGWRLMPRFEGDFQAGFVYGAFAGLAGTLLSMMLADWFLPFVYNIGFPGFRTSALAWMFLGGLLALEQGFRAQEA
jgi:O-antigen ligase